MKEREASDDGAGRTLIDKLSKLVIAAMHEFESGHFVAERAVRPKASLALHRDHDAARGRMPLRNQRPVAGIVVPILDRLLTRKFDNDNAARPWAFEVSCVAALVR